MSDDLTFSHVFHHVVLGFRHAVSLNISMIYVLIVMK